MRSIRWCWLAAMAAFLGNSSAALAAESPPACAPITRANVVRCVLAASLETEVERRALAAARAREESARTILPSNPTLSGWVARRRGLDAGVEANDTNFAVTVAQEVEIAGQRGARRRAAALASASRAEIVRGTERAVAAEALRIYFEVLAAREEAGVMQRLEDTFRRVAGTAQAGAERGTAAGVDADVAEASFVRISTRRIEAVRRANTATAVLASRLGAAPGSVTVEGELSPLGHGEPVTAGGVPADAPSQRPEIRALEAESRSEAARAGVFRRLRVPNPTVSLFAERDGFGERVLGVGLSLPIPLPHPLGQTYFGEIEEAEALAREAHARAQRTAREITRDLAAAREAYEASRTANALYPAERLARAERTLAVMSDEIRAGRLDVRDAVVAQEALVEMLFAAIEVRRELCLSSVNLAYAAGVALERGAP